MSDDKTAEIGDFSSAAVPVATGNLPVGASKRRPPGRPRGVGNRVGRAAKEAIALAEPERFLVGIMEGRVYRAASQLI